MTHNYLLEFYGAIANRLPTRSCSAGRFATCALLLLMSLHGQAQNYTVNTTADGTSSSGTVNLRGAILAADAAGGNHTITVPAGIYTLTMGTIAFGTTAQNITITGAGPTSTTINMGTGANQDRIFLINPPGTNSNIQTNITGIQFSNGLLTSDSFGGGAILAGGPTNTIAISNCIFTNNSVSTSLITPGGAVRFSGGGAVTISNCTFASNNNPRSGGGAIRFDMLSGETGSFNVTNNIFNGNTANAASANGGAISIGIAGLASSSAFASSITGNTFIGNTASLGEGGAISISNGTSGSTATINYNRFFNNTASTNSTRSAVTVAGASGNVDLSNNWWGCNSGPTGCPDKAANNGSGSGTNTYTPYLQLRTTSIPASLCGGGASTITSSFTLNSNSQTIATSNLSAFTGVPISFSAVLGTITNAQTTIQTNGLATATYTAGTTPGTGTVNALVDNVPNTDVTARTSITINASPTISTQPAPVAACVGTTASFSAVASGSGTLSFQWYKGNTLLSNGSTGTGSTIAITSTATTSRLTITTVSAADAATNYSVRVTSSTGSCTTNSTNAALTLNNPPPATLSNNGPLSCNATSVTLTASGGSTYQFSTGATQVGNGPTATVSTTGVYSVTVVGAGGCSATASTTVTDSGGSLIAFTGQPSSASTVTVGAVVTTSVFITSTGPSSITYQWYKDNLSSPVTGQTSATLTLNNVQLSDAGSYSVVAVGTCNSLTSTAFNLTVNPNTVPLSLSLTASPTTILTTGTTTLSASVSGGSTPYSYVFTGPGTITQTPTSNTASVSGLSAGVQTFTVVVTDISTPTSQTITGTVSVTVSTNTPTISDFQVSPDAVCAGSPATFTATVGNVAGAYSYTLTNGTNTITGMLSSTVFSQNLTASGSGIQSFTLTVSANGQVATATTSVIVNNPATPTLLTQQGQSYPGGQSTVSVDVNSATVNLIVSGCNGGTINWTGPNNTSGSGTTINVPTSAPGTFVYMATCTTNGCTSPAASATVSVGLRLRVLHRDVDNYADNNSVQPVLIVANGGGGALPLSAITLRYYLTVENFMPLTNLFVNYAQVGAANVKSRYVPLDQPRQGAFGYVEYSFTAGAGQLAAGTDTGPIQGYIAKSDYGGLNELDDYSYATVRDRLLENPRITAYYNGILVWGQEPALVTPRRQLRVLTESKNGPSATAITTNLLLRNEGNLPINYQDLRIRYYFTADNQQQLAFYSDFRYEGALRGQLVKISPPLANADTYLEITPTFTGQLMPLSNPGVIRYSVYSPQGARFNQTNDYSYQDRPEEFSPNSRIVVYVGSERVWGQEPGASARIASVEPASELQVRLLGNPLVGGVLEAEVMGAAGQPLTLQLTSLGGQLVAQQRIGAAGEVERIRLAVGQSATGLLLLQVSTPTQRQALKVLKID